MSNKKNKLSGVADTLFIPLAARVEISSKYPDYFYDAKSMELAGNEKIQEIRRTSSEYSMMASVARYYNMDKFVGKFVKENGKSNIICLGSGLETMNYRLSELDAHFYNVDFESVIENRKTLLGTGVNETMIPCDITDLKWTKEIETNLPIMMIVSGVFQYFQPEMVSFLLRSLKEIFPGSEMVFDATDEVGIRYAQKYVKKTGNMSAMMYFYVNDPKRFSDSIGAQLIETRHFYDEARRMLKRKVNLYTRIAMKVADDKNRTMLIHIKF